MTEASASVYLWLHVATAQISLRASVYMNTLTTAAQKHTQMKGLETTFLPLFDKRSFLIRLQEKVAGLTNFLKPKLLH